MKAYKLKSDSSGYKICPNCEEEAEFNKYDAWKNYDGDHLFNNASFAFYDSEPEQVTVWWCHACEEYTDTEPDSAEQDTWMCGNCGWKTHEQHEAERCCL